MTRRQPDLRTGTCTHCHQPIREHDDQFRGLIWVHVDARSRYPLERVSCWAPNAVPAEVEGQLVLLEERA